MIWLLKKHLKAQIRKRLIKIINKMKELTIRKIIFSLIIFICAYYYYRTLVIHLWYYLVILCVALLIDLVLYFTLNLKFNLTSIAKTIVYLYFFLFSILPQFRSTFSCEMILCVEASFCLHM